MNGPFPDLRRHDLSQNCNCGSGEPRYPLKDGYGIFMTYVCDKCVRDRRKEFRPDISEQYDHDEPLDDE